MILTPDGQEIRKSGSGSDSAGVAIRNVAGEMLGSMTAVNWAIENKYPAVEIRYDYEGVEKWVTGVWRAKTPLTSKYAAHMQEAGRSKDFFCKIAAIQAITTMKRQISWLRVHCLRQMKKYEYKVHIKEVSI